MKNVVLPDLGEGIEKGIVSAIYVAQGEQVNSGDDVVELVTDKAAFNVPAEHSGVIKEIHVKEGQQVRIGEVLMVVE